MKTEREVLDSFLQPNLAIQSKEVFVAPARNAKRRVDGLSGQIAAIKTLASAINHGPRLKYSLTCQNPFDAIAPRTIEQHGENRITRRCGRLTRLWQTRSHFGQNSINDKVVAVNVLVLRTPDRAPLTPRMRSCPSSTVNLPPLPPSKEKRSH